MSQASRIVVLLRERPHTCAEILREVPCIVHSRISELRDKGYVIAHQTTGPGAGGSLYTLLSEPDRTAVAWPGDSSGSLSGEESKPAIRPSDIRERAKDAETPASKPPGGAAPMAGAHPAPAAQLMSPPPDAAGPASPSSPEGCPQNESAQQLSLEVAA